VSGRQQLGVEAPAVRSGASVRRPSRAVIAGVLFAATAAFLYAFRNEGIFHLDAVFLAQAVEDIYANNPWPTDWRFGAVLANAVVYFPFWLVGENAERATVLSSIFFHACSIPMAFLFLERLSGSRLLATLSAGLLAFAPVYTIPNTFGKEYGLAVFLMVTAFWLALGARQRGSAARAAASAFTFALSYIVWEGLLAITPVYLVVLVAPRFERPVWTEQSGRVAAGALLGFAVGLAFDLSTSLHVMLRTYASSAQMTAFRGIASPVLPRALGDLERFLGWPFLAASALGLGLALRQPRYRSVLPLASLLILSLAFYGNLSTYGPRYLVVGTLGLSMLAGVAFDFLLTCRMPVRVLSLALYAFIIGSMIAVSYPQLAARHTYNGAKRYAQMVAEVTEPASLIIVMDDSRFVQYYARRATLGHPIGDRAATEAWIGKVRQALERGPVYLTESGLSYDPGYIVQLAIDANFSLTLVGTRTSEDYHQAEGGLRWYEGHLWRLTAR
jgi:hypothetical protein